MWPNEASACERSECPTSGPEGARSAGWLLGEVIRMLSQGQLMSVVKDLVPASTYLSLHCECSGFVLFKEAYALIRRDLTFYPSESEGGLRGSSRRFL